MAVELRRLRERAGRPSYREMSVRAHVSPSALSEAARGQRWPSWTVVAAYVAACGEDPASWRPRWEALRVGDEQAAPATTDPVQPDGEQPLDGADRAAAGPTPSEPASRRRQIMVLAATAAALALTTAVLLGLSGRPATRSDSAAAAPRPSPTQANTPAAHVPIRRRGTLVLTAGHVADLDSTTSTWAQHSEPGPPQADVWFGAQDRALHGVGNNDIAVLPNNSPGGFWACALDQDYGATLHAADIRAGRILCGLTATNRVAQIRVTSVHHDTAGQPDRITLDITVWAPAHKT
ncbi:helix-turn-helix transcriptional regulator [Streptomyces sp. NPDC006668]|uniref:helix-turn-helix domain-containing protein n=1 Tax=Streptomyces sp. NPDC006668 TaxID=3156903 RepID=UPI0033E0DF0B